MKYLQFKLSFLLTVLLWSSCAGSASNPDNDPYPNQDPAIRSGVLENGFTYFIRENPKPENRAYLSLVVRAGSINEEENERGLFHLMEHMAFNGTARFDKNAIISYFDRIGMRFGDGINAYTSFEETVYHLEIPMDDPQILETSFQILEDWSRGLSFNPEEVEKEKGVIEEEWRLGKDVNGRRRDFSLPLLLNNSRWSDRLPIGSMDVVRSASPEQLRNLYKKWYRPERMALVLVGVVDAEAIESRIRQGFGWIAETPKPQNTNFNILPYSARSIHTFSDPEQRYNIIEVNSMTPTKTLGWQEGRLREILRRMTKAALDQRFSRLTEAEDPPYLTAFVEFSNLARRFDINSIYLVAHPGKMEEGFKIALMETEQLRNLGFSTRELEREKSSILQELDILEAQIHDRPHPEWANDIVEAFLSGTPVPSIADYSHLTKNLLASLTLEQWNTFAKDNLRLDKRLVIVSINETQGTAPAEERIESLLNEAPNQNFTDQQLESIPRLMDQAPPSRPIVRTQRWDEFQLTLWELSNGMKVYWKKTDFKDSEILIKGYRSGGLSLAGDNEFSSALWSSDLLTESGLGPWSNAQLTDFFADKTMSMELSSEEAAVWLTANSTPKDLETWFQMFFLRLTQTPKNAASFRSVQTRLVSLAQARLDNPQAKFQDFLSELLKGGKTRSQVLSPESVGTVGFDSAHTWFSRLYGSASGWNLVFVGDLDPAVLENLARTYLSAIPAGTPTPPVDRQVSPRVRGRQVMRSGLENQATSIWVLPSSENLEIQDLVTAQALTEILKIRLREKVREELGGTYSIGFEYQYRPLPAPTGLAFVHFGSDPEKADLLMRNVKSEIARVLQSLVTTEEIQTFREMRRRDLESAQRTNDFWVSNVLSYSYGLRDLALLPRFMERIANVTPERILNLAKRILIPERSFEAILLPQVAQ